MSSFEQRLKIREPATILKEHRPDRLDGTVKNMK